MSETQIFNGEIVDTFLGVEDHGILTSYVFVQFGGSHQGYGGYGLDNRYCAAWIKGVCRAVGVDNWKDLKGKYVRIQREDGRIICIGHIVEERWYSHQDTIRETDPT